MYNWQNKNLLIDSLVTEYYLGLTVSWGVSNLVDLSEDRADLELLTVLSDDQGVNGHHWRVQPPPMVPVKVKVYKVTQYSMLTRIDLFIILVLSMEDLKGA